MTDNLINRAELLMEQQRYSEAEKILRDVLATNPTDIQVQALLSEVSLQLNKYDEAYMLINSAIGVSPDIGHLFYIKARITIHQDKYDEAEENISRALELDPADADFYALWASIKLTRKQFEKALELANKALELDAQNLLGLNIRSTALLKLNKKDDSYKTIEGALREDPNNAYTHANYGWGLLEKGDHKKALEHFRESLKNDPNFSYAQAGMVEALKANNLFYRLFLKYAFWIGNLTAKYQWGVIIGFYLGVKVLKSIAQNNQALQPFLTPLVILLSLIAFSTWVISPLSNLFLRLNPYGKHLLDKKEIVSSNFVGASLLVFLTGVLFYFIASDDKFLTIAFFGFAMMLPLGTMFNATKVKHILIIYTAAMALIGAGAVYITFTTGEIFNMLTPIFVIGFIGFQWAANFFLIRENNV